MDFGAVEANLRESFRILARHSPTGEVREYDGVTIASAGVAFQMFNAAFLSAPVASEYELERRLAQCAVHFDARGLDWACWICQDWLSADVRRHARNIFSNRRLHLSAEMPGMVCGPLPPPRRDLPPLDFRRVVSGPVRDDFCAIGSVCFNVPLPWFRQVFGSNAVWHEFASWVGYLDGTPVSTAAAVAAGGVIGLYNIATLPAYQRRGYAEAVMRHAIDQARREHGLRCTILQSTSQGFHMYERMGYRTVTKVAVYST